MKRWFRLILVCCLLLGVLLSLTQAVGRNHRLPVVGSGPLFAHEREPSSASTVSLLKSMESHLAHAGPFQSLVPECGLTAGNISPPGLKTYAPPEPIGPRRVAGQAGNSNQRPRATFSTKSLGFNRRSENRGFATAFS